jgi:predicted choloylglycine hydrolase
MVEALSPGSAPAPCGFPVITASGSRFAIGSVQGEQARPGIQAFLADRTARIEPFLGRRFDMAVVQKTVRGYRTVIEAQLPDIAEEIHGLAHGAQIDIADAYLLQLRRELVGYQKIPPMGDCTTVAMLAGRDTTLAQTIDLNGGMTPELGLLDLTLPADGRRVLMATFTGLLGYLGMNDRGLAVCLNLVLSGDWRPGIPGYMLIRHLLDTADTVEDCIEIVRRLPRASSRALTIGDSRQLVCVEYTPTGMVVTRASRLAHANHFLDSALALHDEINPFARTASLARQDAGNARLQALDASAGTGAYFALLATAPIHVPDNGDLRRECTVATTVLRPGRGWMGIKPGGTDQIHEFGFAIQPAQGSHTAALTASKA